MIVSGICVVVYYNASAFGVMEYTDVLEFGKFFRSG